MSESLPILVIGAGVAGPTLALSLHQQGYKVILFEKFDHPSGIGSSLNLAPNGLRVLAQLGLAEPLFSRNLAAPVEVSAFRTDTGPLIASNAPSVLPKHFGFPFAGVRRSVFLSYLVETMQAQGIDLRFEHSLTSLRQTDDSVIAVFENGREVKGSFVVGCDGLHSQTRIALFGDEVAEYTGLTQTAGLTQIPRRVRALQNVFGDNIHLVSYAVGRDSLDGPDLTTPDTTLISWAFTRPEKEARESWKGERGDEFRAYVDNHVNWDWEDGISAKELVKGSANIIKFGLYDRKKLSTWNKGRVVLIGDAAHPTAPHLGQGANQALEDVSHLTTLLNSRIPPSTFSEGNSPPTEALKEVFDALDAIRIPRTSALVRAARAQGQQRILPAGSKEAAERNERIKAEMSQGEEQIVERARALLGL